MMNDERIGPRLSIVLPVYNEVGNLAALDAEIRAALTRFGRPAEILYVDDGSSDGSRELLQRLASDASRRDDGVRVRSVFLRRNYGQTAAMAAGFQLAEGEIILPMDADGQNHPDDIARLVLELEKGYDVVSGWRKRRKDKAISRKLPSKVANWLIGVVSGVKLHDYGCTLKAYRASLLKELQLYGEMHRFIPLYLGNMGGRVTEIEVDHRPRASGTSKYGARRILKVSLDLVLIAFMTKFYTRPMHFFGMMAHGFGIALVVTFFLMLAIKYGWFRLIGYNYQATFVETPLPILAAIFLLGSVVSLFFGILAEVLIRVHYESRGIRPFTIEAVADSRPSNGNV